MLQQLLTEVKLRVSPSRQQVKQQGTSGKQNSHPAYTYATQSAPFIYSGDGSVKEYGKFKLGTTSYLLSCPSKGLNNQAQQ